jgi:hypothetical protein
MKAKQMSLGISGKRVLTESHDSNCRDDVLVEKCPSVGVVGPEMFSLVQRARRRWCNLHNLAHRSDSDEDREEDEADADETDEGDFRQFRNFSVETEGDCDQEGRDQDDYVAFCEYRVLGDAG